MTSAWIYEVMEVFDKKSRPLGKYRVVRWKDDQPDYVEGLCTHSHASKSEALDCTCACHILDIEFRERIAMPEPRLS